MLQLSHPEVRREIDRCEQAVRKLTGNPTISISFVQSTRDLSFEEIEKIVCKATGITKEEAYARSRKMVKRRTRQLIGYYARMLTDMSFQEIGQRIGGKDHTTVMANVQAIKDLLESYDEETVEYVDKINRAINRKV